MSDGVAGRLITASFIRDRLPTMSGVEPVPPSVATWLVRWAARLDTLGAASSVRAITDIAVVPLLDRLGFAYQRQTESEHGCVLQLGADQNTRVTALISGWSEPLDREWRAAVIGAIASDARWCICSNGRVLRLVDARRTWSRAYLEIDLAQLARDKETQAVLWALVRADALAGPSSVLDRAVDLSDRHGADICRALGSGVLEALETLCKALSSRRTRSKRDLFEQSLTVLYRVLFLLFAEARGLVPIWHPVYRDRYSLEAIVATLLTGRSYRGLWQAVRAISKLAHTGYAVGELRVTAFNGRLFAPSQADAFDRTRVDDAVMNRTVLAVSTTPVNRHGRRARIVYRDLDVEQLGAVYERVLEYEPTVTGEEFLTRTRDLRKGSGTFYTPRAVTAYVVRRTLEPLVRGRRADDILALRVLDPSMGSGAFLVAACRYLAGAVEDALVGEGRWHAHDIAPIDRAELRRTIASRCLFGVDLNPMAVQLARLSLWLTTLAADKPLSFLDHHLITGNSLVGASLDDIWRHPSRRTARRNEREEQLPLFDREAFSSAVEYAVRLRLDVTARPDDTAAIVHEKEQMLGALDRDDAAIRKWVRVLDLWCSAWFRSDQPRVESRVMKELISSLLNGQSTLPPHTTAALLAQAADVARRHRFVHFPLAFPEVFADAHGVPLAAAGFDAVLGNPPWDMVRGDSGNDHRRQTRRIDARQLTDFVRESGIYHVDTRAHANLYQWFVERALHLVRRGGRIGLVLPAGIASDTGSAPLRRYLFDRVDVDSLTGLDNREAIFPIHRSVKFVLLTCTAGQPTSSIACRFGITRADALESDADQPARRGPRGGESIALTRAFISRLSGADDLGIPDFGTRADLELLERISATVPRLGHEDGWHVHFGRELNATDDRALFTPYRHTSDARPVVEGKQIDPFRVSLDTCRFETSAHSSSRIRIPRRARLAYRDVASATNRLTLIAAIIPARAVTTHTLFCLKTPLALAQQHVLCALLNSFVANYLIRMRVNTHVTVALVSRLPVPVLHEGEVLFERLRWLSEALRASEASVEVMDEYAELQALAAIAYGLRREELEHVLGTFPLIPAGVKDGTLSRYDAAVSSLH